MEGIHGIVQRLSLGATDLALRGFQGERKRLSPLEHQDRISHMMVEETGKRLATALSMLYNVSARTCAGPQDPVVAWRG
jgi:hypothetical protein